MIGLKKIAFTTFAIALTLLPSLKAEEITCEPFASIGISTIEGYPLWNASFGYAFTQDDSIAFAKVYIDAVNGCQNYGMDISLAKKYDHSESVSFYLGAGTGYAFSRYKLVESDYRCEYCVYGNAINAHFIFGTVYKIKSGDKIFLETKVSQPFEVDRLFRNRLRSPSLTVSYGLYF